MADFDPDTVVVEVVRKQTGNASAGPESRFAEDLGLSENGRKALFAFMVEAFTARGLNLPARGFFLSDFLVCKSPGDVQRAIKDIMSGARKQRPAGAKAAAASPAPPATATSPAAATATASPVPTAPASQAAVSDEAPREKRKPATSRAARSPAKAKGGTAKKTAKKAPARKAPKSR